jgi:hypothetical protein
MSAFRPSGGSSGGGIDPAQLAALVDDNEAASLYTGLANTVNSRADQLSDAVNNARVAILDNLQTAGAFPGKVELVNRASGQATAGSTRASGFAIPQQLWTTIRSTVLPYAASGSFSSNEAATGAFRAVQGNLLYLLRQSAFNSLQYAARAYDTSTGIWSNLPSCPVINAQFSPTVWGTVNGKLIATGLANFVSGSGTVSPLPSTQIYNPATNTWSQVANQAVSLEGSGIADLRDGRCVLFGGRSQTGSGALTTATNVTADVRIYNEATFTWTAQPAFPVRVYQAKTSVAPDGRVFVFPATTSDGTTLVNGSRRFFGWLNGVTTEYDPLPAEVALGAFTMFCLPDGRLVYVPVAAPASGSRARVLNPAAASGAQWSNYDWSFNESASLQSLPNVCEVKATDSGFAITAMTVASGVSGLVATYAGAAPNWAETFYQVTN